MESTLARQPGGPRFESQPVLVSNQYQGTFSIQDMDFIHSGRPDPISTSMITSNWGGFQEEDFKSVPYNCLLSMFECKDWNEIL